MYSLHLGQSGKSPDSYRPDTPRKWTVCVLADVICTSQKQQSATPMLV